MKSLALICILAACSPLDFATSPAPTLYELSPKSTFDEMPSTDKTLAIDIPDARIGLNSARIALRPKPTALDYYADALWIDVVPSMVRTLVRESFDNSGVINVLNEDAIVSRGDYVLGLHVREFQAEYADLKAPPLIVVQLEALLESNDQADALAKNSFGAKVRSAGTSVPEIIEAFDIALGRAMKGLVQWTAEKMAGAEI